jgi:CheY-like chemotaxis protein
MDASEQQSESILAGYRLLVVEDDYFVAQDLCAILRDHGATVLGPAPSVSSARSLVGALRPDCVLLDINLDGEHAFDLAKELQANGTQTVFTTGYDPSIVPPKLRGILCLQKPIDTNALRGLRERLPGKLSA